MKQLVLLLFFTFSFCGVSQEITLSHNVGHTIIDQSSNPSCTGGNVDWARVFDLEDFGITGDYTITEGIFGIQEANTSPGVGITVNVYAIDQGFPETFDENMLLGSSNLVPIPPTSYSLHNVFFPDPILINNDIDRILVEASLASQTQNVFIGGTAESAGDSWIKTSAGCIADYYQTTVDIGRPNLNYYITVTGDHVLGFANKEKVQLKLYPNPADENLTIQLPQSINVKKISVYTVNGKLIMEEKYTELLDVSSLQAGFYFIRVETDQSVISQKFLKN